MWAAKVVVAAAVVLAGVAVAWLSKAKEDGGAVFEPQIRHVEPASPCAWRNAETEFTNWFPGATRFYTQDVILSGQRGVLQEQLKRPLRPEEMLLHPYVVASNNVHLGTVLTRRIKGEHGAIEVAVGLGADGRVQRFNIQQIREPEEVVRALQQFRFEDRFQGKGAYDDLTSVLKEAGSAGGNPSARAIAEDIASEVSALLVLYEAGQGEFRAPHH